MPSNSEIARNQALGLPTYSAPSSAPRKADTQTPAPKPVSSQTASSNRVAQKEKSGGSGGGAAQQTQEPELKREQVEIRNGELIYKPTRQVLASNVVGLTTSSGGIVKNVTTSEGGSKLTYNVLTGKVESAQNQGIIVTSRGAYSKSTGKELDITKEKNVEKIKALGYSVTTQKGSEGATDYYYKQVEREAQLRGARSLAGAVESKVELTSGMNLLNVREIKGGYEVSPNLNFSGTGYSKLVENAFEMYKKETPYAETTRSGDIWTVRQRGIADPAYYASKYFSKDYPTKIVTSSGGEKTITLTSGKEIKFAELSPVKQKAFNIAYHAQMQPNVCETISFCKQNNVIQTAKTETSPFSKLSFMQFPEKPQPQKEYGYTDYRDFVDLKYNEMKNQGYLLATGFDAKGKFTLFGRVKATNITDIPSGIAYGLQKEQSELAVFGTKAGMAYGGAIIYGARALQGIITDTEFPLKFSLWKGSKIEQNVNTTLKPYGAIEFIGQTMGQKPIKIHRSEFAEKQYVSAYMDTATNVAAVYLTYKIAGALSKGALKIPLPGGEGVSRQLVIRGSPLLSKAILSGGAGALEYSDTGDWKKALAVGGTTFGVLSVSDYAIEKAGKFMEKSKINPLQTTEFIPKEQAQARFTPEQYKAAYKETITWAKANPELAVSYGVKPKTQAFTPEMFKGSKAGMPFISIETVTPFNKFGGTGVGITGYAGGEPYSKFIGYSNWKMGEPMQSSALSARYGSEVTTIAGKANIVKGGTKLLFLEKFAISSPRSLVPVLSLQSSNTKQPQITQRSQLTQLSLEKAYLERNYSRMLPQQKTSRSQAKTLSLSQTKDTTLQGVRSLSAQKIREIRAQNIRTIEMQNTRAIEAQNIRTIEMQSLRTVEAQKLRLTTALKLRLVTAQKLRLLTPQKTILLNPPILKLGSKFLKRVPTYSRKTRKPGGKIAGVRSMYADLFSVAYSQIKYGKGTSPSLIKRPYVWKYERNVAGRVPTVEMLGHQKG